MFGCFQSVRLAARRLPVRFGEHPAPLPYLNVANWWQAEWQLWLERNVKRPLLSSYLAVIRQPGSTASESPDNRDFAARYVIGNGVISPAAIWGRRPPPAS